MPVRQSLVESLNEDLNGAKTFRGLTGCQKMLSRRMKLTACSIPPTTVNWSQQELHDKSLLKFTPQSKGTSGSDDSTTETHSGRTCSSATFYSRTLPAECTIKCMTCYQETDSLFFFFFFFCILPILHLGAF
ncbi:unnamed protein product [Urochloa humidicola]